jgi:hypothetical protein
MLRHIRHDRTYWFCRNCWQEMPDLTSVLKANTYNKRRERLLNVSSLVLKKQDPTPV